MQEAKGDAMGRVALWAGVCLTGLVPVAASAQAVGDGQGVADRPRPDYDPRGDQVGSFTLYPSLTLSAAATNNYLATDTDQRGDVYFVIDPELDARRIGARTSFDARAFYNQSLHADLGSENTSQYGLSSVETFAPTHDTQISIDGTAAHYVESRASLGAFQGSEEPVRYELYHAGAGISHSFTDLTLSANESLEYRDYHNTFYPDGTPIDQHYRDVREFVAGGSAKYDLRNGIGLIVSGGYSDEHYTSRQFDPGILGFPASYNNLNRDSSGFNVTGGVTLELTHLIFGNIQVGYLNRNYVDPRLTGFSGLSYSADVLWNVTPLTSLRLVANRTVQDSSSPFIAGNTVSAVHLFADHELYRYVIVSADAGYDHFRPNGLGIGGNEYTVGAGARYLINRRYTLSGNVRYAGRTSDSSLLRYNAVYGTLSFRIAF